MKSLNPLDAYLEKLGDFGFTETDIPNVYQERYKGLNALAITNSSLTFIISDSWHDQQIIIELLVYQPERLSLLEPEEIIDKYNLHHRAFKELTSYYHQSKEQLIRNQIEFIQNILSAK